MKINFVEEESNNVDSELSPISVACALINHATHYEETKCLGFTSPAEDVNTFNTTQLRQIAEHLLVYCNHNQEE